MEKGSVHQKNLTILNIYVPSNRALKCRKHELELQGEKKKKNKSGIIVGDFNTAPSINDRTSRQKHLRTYKVSTTVSTNWISFDIYRMLHPQKNSIHPLFTTFYTIKKSQNVK